MLLIGLIFACVLTIGVDGGTCKECKTAYGAAAKDDDTKKCTALKAHIACLEDATGEECPLDAAAIKVITDGKADISAGCDLTGGCKCQYDLYTTALTDDTIHCTALKKRVSCLRLQTDKGCGTKTVVELATATKTKADDVTTTCTIDKTCGCELAYAKTNIGDAAKKCTASTAFITCLGKITTTDKGCAGTKTAAELKTAEEKLNLCPKSSMKPLLASLTVVFISAFVIMI